MPMHAYNKCNCSIIQPKVKRIPIYSHCQLDFFYIYIFFSISHWEFFLGGGQGLNDRSSEEVTVVACFLSII